jgi:hypothetical protein
VTFLGNAPLCGADASAAAPRELPRSQRPIADIFDLRIPRHLRKQSASAARLSISFMVIGRSPAAKCVVATEGSFARCRSIEGGFAPALAIRDGRTCRNNVSTESV